jgi:hypothetical protein
VKRTRRTRRGWRVRLPIPMREPEPPPFALRLYAAIAALDEDEQRACLVALGQLDQLDGADRHAALARLGERLGIGPPDHFGV